MIIIGCSQGKHLAKKVANKLRVPYSELTVKKFPDSELYLKFNTNVKNKKVLLFQSFYGDINDLITEVLFAADTARDLKAKSIALVAPYFPYLRQDKRFKPGEAVSLKVIADIIDKFFDEIYIIDPHLHRERTLSHIFKIKAHKLSACKEIADYIKKKIKNPIIIGPDWESYKWAGKVAIYCRCMSYILKKERVSARKVKISLNKKVNLKEKNIVIVDDIISTGHTILQAAKSLRSLGVKNITAICVHGIFSENALQKLKKANINVIATNTIPSSKSKIDISSVISERLR